MFADYFPIAGCNFARIVIEKALKEFRYLDFAQKAYSLTVLFFGNGNIALFRDSADLGFCDFAQGKSRRRQLVRHDAGEEVGLVLVLVQEAVAAILHRSSEVVNNEPCWLRLDLVEAPMTLVLFDQLVDEALVGTLWHHALLVEH